MSISAEHSFFLMKMTDVKQHSTLFVDAVQRYVVSSQREVVALSVNELDLTKSSLEENMNKWEMESIQTLVKIARDNRLGLE